MLLQRENGSAKLAFASGGGKRKKARKCTAGVAMVMSCFLLCMPFQTSHGFVAMPRHQTVKPSGNALLGSIAPTDESIITNTSNNSNNTNAHMAASSTTATELSTEGDSQSNVLKNSRRGPLQSAFGRIKNKFDSFKPSYVPRSADEVQTMVAIEPSNHSNSSFPSSSDDGTSEPNETNGANETNVSNVKNGSSPWDSTIYEYWPADNDLIESLGRTIDQTQSIIFKNFTAAEQSGNGDDAFFSIGPYKIPSLNASSLPIVESALSSVSGMMYLLNASLNANNVSSSFQIPPMVLVDDLEPLLRSSGGLDDAAVKQIMDVIAQSVQPGSPFVTFNQTAALDGHLAANDTSAASNTLGNSTSGEANGKYPMHASQRYSLGLTGSSKYSTATRPPATDASTATETSTKRISSFLRPHVMVRDRARGLKLLLRGKRRSLRHHHHHHQYIHKHGDKPNEVPELLQAPPTNEAEQMSSASHAVDRLLGVNQTTYAQGGGTKFKTSKSTDPSKIYFASTAYALPYFDTGVISANAGSLLESLSYKPITKTKKPSLKSPGDAAQPQSPPVQMTALPKLGPNDTITMSYLEAILEQRGYGQVFDSTTGKFTSNGNFHHLSMLPVAPSSNGNGMATERSADESGKRSKAVAFPQPRKMQDKDLQRGTVISSALFGTIMATTLLPNLWLVGLLAGAMYGYDITNNLGEPNPNNGGRPKTTPDNALGRLLVGSGRRLTDLYIRAYDTFSTIWFLYKTGQLSYQYYKTYEELDGKFKIQDKMDAWNARFQAGKVKFDRWEQENEVGRRVLATLRTAWLVEEKSLRRGRKGKSRYRVIQTVYDVWYWFRRTCRNAYKSIAKGDGQTWKELVRGVRGDVLTKERGVWGRRIRTILASLILVNLVGAVYTISPSFVAITTAVVTIIWPSWVSELFGRLGQFRDEVQERGRMKDGKPSRRSASRGASGASKKGPKSRNRRTSSSSQRGSNRGNRKSATGRRNSGKSGRSLWSSSRGKSGRRGQSRFGGWFERPDDRQEPGRNEWGILGRAFRRDDD